MFEQEVLRKEGGGWGGGVIVFVVAVIEARTSVIKDHFNPNASEKKKGGREEKENKSVLQALEKNIFLPI